MRATQSTLFLIQPRKRVAWIRSLKEERKREEDLLTQSIQVLVRNGREHLAHLSFWRPFLVCLTPPSFFYFEKEDDMDGDFTLPSLKQEEALDEEEELNRMTTAFKSENKDLDDLLQKKELSVCHILVCGV